MVQTNVQTYGPAAIATAAELILSGEPVAVPTETVYGLAADASNGEAVARIYAAKGRPRFNPLIVHVRNLDHALEIAKFEKAALDLATRFWPGPLTLVLPLGEGAPVAPIVTAGLATVAVRCPAHPAMRDLLEATRRPLAAPSANASGRISPTRAEHVLASLGGRIPLIVDGGPTTHGLESTIVAVAGGVLRVLRPGPIDLGAAATEAAPGEWLIGFGAVDGDSSLSRSADLVEAAANLFDRLHEAEAQDRPRIAVAPVPDEGLGQAINDRLRRAAVPPPG